MVWLIDHPLLFFLATLILLTAATQSGVLVRLRGRAQSAAERSEFDLVRTAMFTLLALLVGFAISMAVIRYDSRKTQEEAEANAIGTAYARLDLLTPEIAAPARGLLRAYAEARIAFYRDRDPEPQARSVAGATRHFDRLWALVAPEARAQPTAVNALVAAGLNDAINAQGYALAAWRNRLPVEVWLLLILVATGCNFLVGVGAEKLSATTRAILPVTVALAFLLIADVEGPRNGFVTVEPVNLDDAAAAMREP